MISMSSMNFRQDDRGAFLLLVALLAVPLVAVIGLAIDGFIVILTLTSCTDVARLAALGAGKVMADMASSDSKSESAAILKQATSRAVEVVKLNSDSIPGRVFYASGFKPEVSVSFGTWYPEESSSKGVAASAPCGIRPCFNPTTVSGEAFDTVKVLVNPPELKTIFIRIVGPKTFDFSVQAFARIDPGTHKVRLIE